MKPGPCIASRSGKNARGHPKVFISSSEPMENSPPGIQTIPSGGGRLDRTSFSAVGRNDAAEAVSRPTISPAVLVFPARALNFNIKTPRHASASTTMLHFGVYVAVPRGTNTNFDSIRMAFLKFIQGLKSFDPLLEMSYAHGALPQSSVTIYRPRFIVSGTCLNSDPAGYCKWRSKIARG
jgi:hypothetical protein